MSWWNDFLNDVEDLFRDPTKPGKVMICFVNRNLEGLDGIKYKFKFDGQEKAGVTTADNYCIELSPTTLNPIQTYVWSRDALQYKKLDDVIPEIGKKKLVRKVLKTFKTKGNPDKLPETPKTTPPPEKPAPPPPPAESPSTDQGNKPKTTKNQNDEPLATPERPVPASITVTQLRKIFPKNQGNPSDEHLQAIANELNPRLADYKLDTPYRRAHFFGQIKRESPDLLGKAESLNYLPEVLISKFSYYKKHKNEASEDGRLEQKLPDGSKKILQKANPEAIANKAYSGPDGNKKLGNVQSGDGYRYRGRGLHQTTGRDNYEGFSKKYPELWGEKIDFLAQPDKVAQMPYTLRSAISFWVSNKCFNKADQGISDVAIDAVTQIINAGEIDKHKKGGYDKPAENPVLLRRKYVQLAYAALT